MGMYLMDEIKKVKLNDADREYLDEKMRDWPTFQKWAPGLDYDDVLQAFAYEITRPRIRKNIFDKLVGQFNRKAADRNWAQCNAFFAKKVGDAAA